MPVSFVLSRFSRCGASAERHEAGGDEAERGGDEGEREEQMGRGGRGTFGDVGGLVVLAEPRQVSVFEPGFPGRVLVVVGGGEVVFGGLVVALFGLLRV